ncbi:MAG: hypothetical protein ACLFWL_00410 [Candidatus Brocadiia bacterium]
MTTPVFKLVTDTPLLDLSAVPWTQPKRVVKSNDIPENAREVRSTIMHPSVIEAGRYLNDPPARYLMYYAPHHSPGIGAAASDKLEGPWEPLEENPILHLEDCGGIHGHISGPDVIWMPETERFRMYFHGSVPEAGQQSGVAASADGIHFETLRNEPILTKPYLRVFRKAGDFYGVCRFGRNLGLVRSPDGLTWEEWPNGLLLETGEKQEEFDRLRHHCLWIEGTTLYVFYCTYRDPECRLETIRAAVMSIEGDWQNWDKPQRLGDVIRPELEWESNNIRDPYLIEAGGRLYMFYVGGNETGISLAIAKDGPETWSR